MTKNNGLAGEPLTILLVEDDFDHAEMIRRVLADHHVVNMLHHVADGEEALDYLFRRGKYLDEKKSPKPHVILLDLRLPKIDGMEVLKEIKKSDKTKNIPVVVVTTSDAEKDIVEAYGYNVNSYLVKPIDYDKFKSMVNVLGFYWLAWNRLPWSRKND